MMALGDLQGARDISENHLLPVVTCYQLSDLLVPVRAQYAVVLAWCGEIDAAREEMFKLEAYHVTGIGHEELANQRALIEQIASGVVALPQGVAEDQPARRRVEHDLWPSWFGFWTGRTLNVGVGDSWDVTFWARPVRRGRVTGLLRRGRARSRHCGVGHCGDVAVESALVLSVPRGALS